MKGAVPRITGSGICCLDHIFIAPQIEWGDKTRIHQYRAQGGGIVATALVAASRLGGQCRIFSMLGDDPTGDVILGELREEGIDTSGLQVFPCGQSPFSFVHVSDESGERTIFHRAGIGLDWGRYSVDLSPIAESDVLLVDHYYPELALAASKVARDAGVTVLGDLIPSPKTEAIVRNVDFLIAPVHYARKIGFEHDLPKALSSLHDMGPERAMITLGADGWIYSGPEGQLSGKAFDVDVVDTTGAGDVFHGAFAFGLAQGWGVERCARFSSAVAAIKCTKPGGRTGIPNFAQALEFLDNR